jgi:hypothetical protein
VWREIGGLSRNGPVSDPPPGAPHVNVRNFFSSPEMSGGGGHQLRRLVDGAGSAARRD